MDQADPPLHEGTTVVDPDDPVRVADVEEASVEDVVEDGFLDHLEVWAKGLRPAWRAFAVYLLYQAIAIMIWVVPIMSRFTTMSLGGGVQDSRYYRWALTWTPWAIAHHLNPLHDPYLFAPGGVDLAWSAFIPGPALVAWPVTALIGPLGSLNVVLATAPAMAGWAAYLLCNRLTRRFWPSVLGGFLFGFSAYVAGTMVGYVNLIVVFPIPLLVYLAVRRVEGSVGAVTFVAGFTASLVGLFSISTELFATTTFFAGIAFLGALAFGSGIRRRLLNTGALILLAGAISAVLLAPYLHAALVEAPDRPLYPRTSAASLSSFVVPPPQVMIGGARLRSQLADLTAFPVRDGVGYVGVAVLVMLVGFAITEWRRRSTWLLLGFVLLAAAFAMGSTVAIHGVPHRWPLGVLLADIPLIQSAIPSRLALFMALGVSTIAALWLARAAGPWAWVRWAVVLVAAVSLIPSPPRHFETQDIVPFPASEQLRSVIHPGEVVFAIPYMRGDELLWQESADYWFNLAEGYIGPLPPHLQSGGTIAHGLDARKALFIPEPQEFVNWLDEHGVTAVIMDDRAAPRFGELMKGTGFEQTYAGEGVTVWRPPAA